MSGWWVVVLVLLELVAAFAFLKIFGALLVQHG